MSIAKYPLLLLLLLQPPLLMPLRIRVHVPTSRSVGQILISSVSQPSRQPATTTTTTRDGRLSRQDIGFANKL